MNFEEFFNIMIERDILNSVVPIIVIIVGWIPGAIKVLCDADKYWKCSKNMSAQNSYIKYFWYIYGWGLIILVLCSLFATAIMNLIRSPFSANIIRKVYLVISIISYAILGYACLKPFAEGKGFKYKKAYKYAAMMTQVFVWTPFITSAMIWIVLWRWPNRGLSLIVILLCLGIEVSAFVVFDDKSTTEFQYATFYLSDGTVISKADADTSYQKGNWIVAKYKDSEEVRFRKKDVKRIEYCNQKEEGETVC